jgi:uncharacterized protein YbcI
MHAEQGDEPLDRLRGRVAETLGYALTKLMKDQIGRGPEDMRVYLVDDIILVRLLKVLTPAEMHVATASEGSDMVKEFRKTLLKTWKSDLEGPVDQALGAHVIRVYADLDTTDDEMMIVIVLDRKIVPPAGG